MAIGHRRIEFSEKVNVGVVLVSWPVHSAENSEGCSSIQLGADHIEMLLGECERLLGQQVAVRVPLKFGRIECVQIGAHRTVDGERRGYVRAYIEEHHVERLRHTKQDLIDSFGWHRQILIQELERYLNRRNCALDCDKKKR